MCGALWCVCVRGVGSLVGFVDVCLFGFGLVLIFGFGFGVFFGVCF